MLKILNVTVDYTKESGGSAVSVQQFSEALGAETVSLTQMSRLDTMGSFSENCIHIPVVEGLLGRSYDYVSNDGAQKFISLVKQSDLVICHKIFRYHTQLTLKACRACGVPYMIVPHGSLDPYVFTYHAASKRLWLALFGRRFFRNAEAIVYASWNEMAKANKSLFRYGHVVNWFVAESPALDPGECKRAISRRYGVKPESRIYLMLARLHSVKRILEVVRGFTAARLPDAVLMVVGPPDEYTVEQVSEFARALGTESVFITGAIFGKAKNEVLAAADFSINMSHRENFCYSIVEGMSFGVPAILSTGNDLATTLVEHGCAISCDYDDSSLVRALQKSATLSSLQVKMMRQQAREWVKNNATKEKFKTHMLDLIHCVLESHKRTKGSE